jgi:hypothetical protein
MVECPAGKPTGFFMRFTIRELVLLTTIVCVSLGWWREHQAHVAAIEEAQRAAADARSLAFFSACIGMPKGGVTVRALDHYDKLQVKYGAPKWPQSNGEFSN